MRIIDPGDPNKRPVFLVVSECSLFRRYFARNWPLLSPDHGFVFLGSAMMILGLNMLGNMNKEATSQKSLGLPFWRLLVASGILAIVIGFFNVVAVRNPDFPHPQNPLLTLLRASSSATRPAT